MQPQHHESEDIHDRMMQMNRMLADVETGILYGLMKGMAGEGESGESRELDTPEFDHS